MHESFAFHSGRFHMPVTKMRYIVSEALFHIVDNLFFLCSLIVLFFWLRDTYDRNGKTFALAGILTSIYF